MCRFVVICDELYIELYWTVMNCVLLTRHRAWALDSDKQKRWESSLRGDHRAAGSAGKGFCRWELCGSTWRPCGDLATIVRSKCSGESCDSQTHSQTQLRTRMKILTWQDSAPRLDFLFRHVCLKFFGTDYVTRLEQTPCGHGVVSLNLNEQTIAEAINHQFSLFLSLLRRLLSVIQRGHYSTTRPARGQRAARVRELLMELGVPRTKMRPQSCKAGPIREVTMTAWGQWLALVTTTAQQINS